MTAASDFRSVRAAIVAEAYTWLRTPYVHCANIKGAGVDCAMLLVEVYKSVGFLAADYDPRPYDPDWYLHRDEELYLNEILPHAQRTSTPEPGDVAMFSFGRSAAHGGIMVSDGVMIHAYRPHGNVGLMEVRELEHRFVGYWAANRLLT